MSRARYGKPFGYSLNDSHENGIEYFYYLHCIFPASLGGVLSYCLGFSGAATARCADLSRADLQITRRRSVMPHRHCAPRSMSPFFTANGTFSLNIIEGCGADSIGSPFSAYISSMVKALPHFPGEIISARSPRIALFR